MTISCRALLEPFKEEYLTDPSELKEYCFKFRLLLGDDKNSNDTRVMEMCEDLTNVKWDNIAQWQDPNLPLLTPVNITLSYTRSHIFGKYKFDNLKITDVSEHVFIDEYFKFQSVKDLSDDITYSSNQVIYEGLASGLIEHSFPEKGLKYLYLMNAELTKKEQIEDTMIFTFSGLIYRKQSYNIVIESKGFVLKGDIDRYITNMEDMHIGKKYGVGITYASIKTSVPEECQNLLEDESLLKKSLCSNINSLSEVFFDEQIFVNAFLKLINESTNNTIKSDRYFLNYMYTL